MAAAPSHLVKYLLSELTGDDGDIALELGEGDARETLRAHSLVLRRAEYFRSALKDSYKEGQMNRVELHDVSPAIMKALVMALYSDDFSHLTSDSSKNLSVKQWFQMCQLAERFLVPDFMVDLAYCVYAKTAVREALSCREYVEVFAQLLGTRVPTEAMTDLLAGFGQAVAGVFPWTVETLLPLVVEATLKKVDARARVILNTMLAKTVTFGENMATTAVQAAKQGALEAAEAIFHNLPNLVIETTSPVLLDKERTTLHAEVSALPSHIQQHLKLTYAMKALQPLSGLKALMLRQQTYTSHYGHPTWYQTDVRRVLGMLQPSEGGNGLTIESRLLQDIESASAGLFAAASTAFVERQQHHNSGDEQQPKRLRTA